MRLVKLGLISLVLVGSYLSLRDTSGKVPMGKKILPSQSNEDKNVFLGSRKNQISLSAPVTASCQVLWNGLRALDLQRLNEDIFRGCLLLPSAGECEKPPETVSLSHQAYLQDCSLFMNKDYDRPSDPELDEKAQQCFLSLVAYRASVGDWMTRDQPLNEITDVHALGDKLLNEMFTSLRGDEPSPANLRAIAERMNELNPDIYSTSKIAAVGDVMEALSDASEDRWDRAKRSLEKLESFHQEDTELAQLGLWVRTEGMKPEKLLEEADRMLKDNPHSGLGYFYKAFAEAGAGNRENVGVLFLNAVQAEPGNPTFVRALENYRAKRPVPSPFRFDFNFRVAELWERP